MFVNKWDSVDETVKVFPINRRSWSPTPLGLLSPTPSHSSTRPEGPTTSVSPKIKAAGCETELSCSPPQMTCLFCETDVATRVDLRVGTYAWLMCLIFVLCGLFLGCCLIPFFMNDFKDAYHICPHCDQVLHVDKKSCFK